MAGVDLIEVLEGGLDHDAARPDFSPEVAEDGFEQGLFLVVVDLVRSILPIST
jgi:hypothetical protein